MASKSLSKSAGSLLARPGPSGRDAHAVTTRPVRHHLFELEAFRALERRCAASRAAFHDAGHRSIVVDALPIVVDVVVVIVAYIRAARMRMKIMIIPTSTL